MEWDARHNSIKGRAVGTSGEAATIVRAVSNIILLSLPLVAPSWAQAWRGPQLILYASESIAIGGAAPSFSAYIVNAGAWNGRFETSDARQTTTACRL